MPWFEPSIYDLEYWGETATDFEWAVGEAREIIQQPGGYLAGLVIEGKALGSGRPN